MRVMSWIRLEAEVLPVAWDCGYVTVYGGVFAWTFEGARAIHGACWSFSLTPSWSGVREREPSLLPCA